MAAAGSTKVVLFALGANFTIAVAKFGAFLWTGSSAMMSEAIHSLVDTSNQALLLYGQKRSTRPPDARHPFGYSKELFFWSFVVAILLFALGAGVAIYEGIEKLLHPHPIKDPHVNYIVLGVAIVLESASTWAAVAEFNKQRAGQPVFQALRGSKDPALFTILAEDVAALLGLFIALAGVAAAHLGGIPEGDGIASLAIGVVLATVAAFIAIEVKGLLIGEAASPDVQQGIARIVTEEAGREGRVTAVNEVRTLQLGSTDILVTVSLDVDDATTAREIEAQTARLERAITTAYPDVRKLYVETQSQNDWNERNPGLPRFAAEAMPIGSAGASAGAVAAVAPPPGRPVRQPSAGAGTAGGDAAKTVIQARPPSRKGKGKRRR